MTKVDDRIIADLGNAAGKVVRRLDILPIDTTGDLEDVLTRSKIKHDIAAATTIEHKHIITRAAREGIVTGATKKRVLTGTTRKGVLAGTTKKHIIAGVAGKLIRPLFTIENVGPIAAEKRITAFFARQQVVAVISKY